LDMGKKFSGFCHATGINQQSIDCITMIASVNSCCQFRCTASCCHISVFIAGANKTGQVEANTVFVSRLSAMPWVNFARVLAVRGAIANTSAIH